MSRSLDLSIQQIENQVRGGENLCSCDGQNNGMWVLYLSQADLDRNELYEPWCKVRENHCSLEEGHREACQDLGQSLQEEGGEL